MLTKVWDCYYHPVSTKGSCNDCRLIFLSSFVLITVVFVYVVGCMTVRLTWWFCVWVWVCCQQFESRFICFAPLPIISYGSVIFRFTISVLCASSIVYCLVILVVLCSERLTPLGVAHTDFHLIFKLRGVLLHIGFWLCMQFVVWEDFYTRGCTPACLDSEGYLTLPMRYTAEIQLWEL